MHDGTWGTGMGWGMWFIPILIIVVFLCFVKM